MFAKFYSHLLPLAFLGSFFGSNKSIAKTETLSWESFSTSVQGRALAGSTLTQPLTENLVFWASSRVADESWISENATLSSRIAQGKGRFEMSALKLENSGDFSSFEVSQPSISSVGDLRSKMAMSGSEIFSSHIENGFRYYERGVSTGFFYSKRRIAVRESSERIDFRVHRDFVSQLAVSGPLFEKQSVGRLEFGTGLKFVVRKGDEVFFDALSAEQSLDDSLFVKSAYAAGLDYSMLYTLPSKWTKSFQIQLALVWKDVGTTQFFIGNKTSKNKRFEALPNNQSFGVGVGLPNIWRGTQAAFRVEYREWKRDVSILNKSIVSLELRAARLLSVWTGLRGTRFAGGLGFRFPNVELSLASFSHFLGESGNEYSSRSFAMEMKGIF